MRNVSTFRVYLPMVAAIALLLAHGGTSFAAGKATNTARVFRISQSISSDAFTEVSFNDEDYDVGNLHSTTTDSECLTVPLRGYGVYAISATVLWGSGTTGLRFIELLVNSTQIAANNVQAPTISMSPVQNVASQFLLNAGDCVTLVVYHTQVGGLSIDANLEMTFVAPGP